MNTATPERIVPRRNNIEYKQGVIYMTEDYDMFTFEPRNRQVRPKMLMVLLESVREKNKLSDYPILVDRNLTVLDGQTRLKVARFLHVPIYFVVASTVTFEDVANDNSKRKSWGPEDYLHRWEVDKHPEYMRLREFMEQFPFLSTYQAINMVSNLRGKTRNASHAFANGLLVCNTYDRGVLVAKRIQDFKPYFKYWNDSGFIGAITVLTKHPAYDHKRMMKKIEAVSTWLVRCPTIRDYLTLLTTIYNYRSREDAGRVNFAWKWQTKDEDE